MDTFGRLAVTMFVHPSIGPLVSIEVHAGRLNSVNAALFFANGWLTLVHPSVKLVKAENLENHG